MGGGSCFVQCCVPPARGDLVASVAGSSSPSLRSTTYDFYRFASKCMCSWLVFGCCSWVTWCGEPAGKHTCVAICRDALLSFAIGAGS
jgi:hypothetical protein